jgi:hypothetical protein
MKEPDESDCYGTANAVCPWCGYEDEDSFELRGDSGDTDCPDCGKSFHYEREMVVTYTTSKDTDEH